MSSPLHLAVALDLGSSHLKAGLLSADGGISGLRRVPAPEARRHGDRCESDPESWERTASMLLREAIAGLKPGLPLGLTSQRSSFLLWRRRDGRPVTPVISWQDRRARAWLARHPECLPEVRRRTGLVLTAHHIAPKLAALQEDDPGLRLALQAGDLLFGTLETFLAWRWSTGRTHTTDPSMAARTGLLDLGSLEWSSTLLDLFGVPRSALPKVEPTAGRDHELLSGMMLTASAADQAVCAAVLLDGAGSRALINIGTGTFVMGPTCPVSMRREGYLTAVMPCGYGQAQRGLMEGPIHAGVPRLWPVDAGGAFPTGDPLPGVLCLPDRSGVGAPHWRADLGPIFSVEPEADMRSQAVVEGLLFRTAEVLAGLFDGAPAPEILMAGAGGGGRILAAGLASLLGRPVELCREPEQTLAGILRLAAGLPPADEAARTVVEPEGGAYLAAKQRQWSAWVRERLDPKRAG